MALQALAVTDGTRSNAGSLPWPSGHFVGVRSSRVSKKTCGLTEFRGPSCPRDEADARIRTTPNTRQCTDTHVRRWGRGDAFLGSRGRHIGHTQNVL